MVNCYCICNSCGLNCDRRKDKRFICHWALYHENIIIADKALNVAESNLLKKLERLD